MLEFRRKPWWTDRQLGGGALTADLEKDRIATLEVTIMMMVHVLGTEHIEEANHLFNQDIAKCPTCALINQACALVIRQGSSFDIWRRESPVYNKMLTTLDKLCLEYREAVELEEAEIIHKEKL